MTTRRTFLGQVSAGAALMSYAGSRAADERCRHLVATATPATVDAPAGKRLPFGWLAAPLLRAEAPSLKLTWPETTATPTALRLALALDMREQVKIEVALTSGRALGQIDLRFGSQFQVYPLPLAPADARALVAEGVALRLTDGAGPVYVFTGGETIDPVLLPHLLVPGGRSPLAEFLDRLASLASVQPFGWMEGCVLDGLLDLGGRWAEEGRRQLGLFFQGDKLIYENPRSEPADNRVYGAEGPLPFAALARVSPDHPLLQLAVDFARQRRREDGSVLDGTTYTSEGSYTVGYPLACIARARDDEELARLALAQVATRQARLFDGQSFWRTWREPNQRGDTNWCRGIAWQLLGLVRVLRELRGRDDLAPLIEGYRALAAYALRFQREDGLWSVLVDQPALTQDTAGSAGIAAAVALGADAGWLDEPARAAARRALAGLQQHLTPDGLLGGASQSNKGGGALQRGDYRVIYQMAMGLMAQLMAALKAV